MASNDLSEPYPPDSLQTLVAVFEWHLQHQPQRVLITLYEEADSCVDLTCADLHRDAVALATGLFALGINKGDKVAIMLPTGREFFAAFLGALWAGAVPVPLYPPARPAQLEDHLRRIAGILLHAQARVLVTIDRAKPLAHLLQAQVESLRSVVTVADFSFIAKRELADGLLIGPALRRLGAVFVDRFDHAQGTLDTRTLQTLVSAGESMVFFPEGSFRRASGLQPFKFGAFVIAARRFCQRERVGAKRSNCAMRHASR